jgi:hypothetical protein
MTSITPINASDFSTYDNGNYLSIRGIASSYDGTIIYVAINGVGLYQSTNSGVNWTLIWSNGGITSVACSSNGVIVYAACLGENLYKSIDTAINFYRVFNSPFTLPGGVANPEVTDPAFAGYTLENVYQITCDGTGNKFIMTTNAAASIYQSIDQGINISFIYEIPGYVTNPSAPTCITSNSDGTILYAALNNTPSQNIVVSKDSGVTWTSIALYGITGPFSNIATNSYGDFVYALDTLSNLNTFYPTHADYAVLIPGSGNTYTALGVYNSGNNLIISQNYYPSNISPTITGGAVVQYTVTNKYIPGQSSLACFKEGTKILTNNGYRKVEDLRKGDLIKTFLNNYIPIEMIGKKEIYHSALKDNRIKDQLYKCSSNKYHEIFEDLVITGCHSILVDNFKDEKQKEKTIEINGKIYATDTKYRLPACVDERAVVYEKSGLYNIYHLALENENYYMNYGIYANGLLVETCSKRYLKEISNMTLI